MRLKQIISLANFQFFWMRVRTIAQQKPVGYCQPFAPDIVIGVPKQATLHHGKVLDSELYTMYKFVLKHIMNYLHCSPTNKTVEYNRIIETT